MRCEWCTAEEAKFMGMPNIGPVSGMGERCRERICKKDELGQFVSEPIEEYMKRQENKK